MDPCLLIPYLCDVTLTLLVSFLRYPMLQNVKILCDALFAMVINAIIDANNHCEMFQHNKQWLIITNNAISFIFDSNKTDKTDSHIRYSFAYICTHGPLTRYVKLPVAHAPGMPGTFSPARGPWPSEIIMSHKIFIRLRHWHLFTFSFNASIGHGGLWVSSSYRCIGYGQICIGQDTVRYTHFLTQIHGFSVYGVICDLERCC